MGTYVLRENVHTFINGRDYGGPGQPNEVELDDEQGQRLVDAGMVDPAGSSAAGDRVKAAEERAGVEREAEKAALEHEDRKIAAAEEVRAGYSRPTEVAPRTPASQVANKGDQRSEATRVAAEKGDKAGKPVEKTAKK